MYSCRDLRLDYFILEVFLYLSTFIIDIFIIIFRTKGETELPGSVCNTCVLCARHGNTANPMLCMPIRKLVTIGANDDDSNHRRLSYMYKKEWLVLLDIVGPMRIDYPLLLAESRPGTVLYWCCYCCRTTLLLWLLFYCYSASFI